MTPTSVLTGAPARPVLKPVVSMLLWQGSTELKTAQAATRTCPGPSGTARLLQTSWGTHCHNCQGSGQAGNGTTAPPGRGHFSPCISVEHRGRPRGQLQGRAHSQPLSPAAGLRRGQGHWRALGAVGWSEMAAAGASSSASGCCSAWPGACCRGESGEGWHRHRGGACQPTSGSNGTQGDPGSAEDRCCTSRHRHHQGGSGQSHAAPLPASAPLRSPRQEDEGASSSPTQAPFKWQQSHPATRRLPRVLAGGGGKHRSPLCTAALAEPVAGTRTLPLALPRASPSSARRAEERSGAEHDLPGCREPCSTPS